MKDILWYSGWWCNNHLWNGKSKMFQTTDHQPVFVYMCCFVPNIRSPECHNYVHVGFSFYMYLKVCMKNVSIKSDFILSCHILSKLVYSKSKCNIIHLSLVLPPTYIYNKPQAACIWILTCLLRQVEHQWNIRKSSCCWGAQRKPPTAHWRWKSRQRFFHVAWFPHIKNIQTYEFNIFQYTLLVSWHSSFKIPQNPPMMIPPSDSSTTGWGPQSIAFSWFMSGWILWFMVDITIVNGDYNGL